MRKLPLEETFHEEINRLLNDPELTRQEIDEHLEEIHPHPLRPISDETVKAAVISKHTCFNFYYYGLHALDGLPEAIRRTLRQAALLHVCGEDQPTECQKTAAAFAKLLHFEAQRFEELAQQEFRPGS